MDKKRTMIEVWDRFTALEKQHLVDAFLWCEKPMSMGQLALTTIATVEDVLGGTSTDQFGGYELYDKIGRCVPDEHLIVRSRKRAL